MQHVIDNQKYSYKEETQAFISENNKEIILETEKETVHYALQSWMAAREQTGASTACLSLSYPIHSHLFAAYP